MELIINNQIEAVEIDSGNNQFIQANTIGVSLEHISSDCIIPVFAKDNESTISHSDFIGCTNKVVNRLFSNETINKPVIRVSHPIKGRIPEAMGKSAVDLFENEKTIYYERMAFLIEVPSIRHIINDNTLCLTIGGVRSYNFENLYNKKTEETFKVFIGFQNKVCTNLCVSTDGYMGELKARTLHELDDKISYLLTSYSIDTHVNDLTSLMNYSITESQFAQLIGRLRLYHLMPPEQKVNIPIIGISDTQINSAVKYYYHDKYFRRQSNGSIDMWRLYNLMTGANKSSYIDTFLDRGLNAYNFSLHIRNALEDNNESWFLY